MTPLRRRLRVLFGLLLLLTLNSQLLTPPARAISNKAGTSGAQFLKLGAGARAAGMAETHLSVASDVYAVYYNPAGLGRTARPMAAGMHADRFQDVDYEFLAFSMPLTEEGGWSRHALGASVANLSVNGIERRTQDTDIPSGTFGASDSAYALTYAYRPREGLGLGATAKAVRSKLDTVTATAMAADLGVQYRWEGWRTIDVGAVIRNVGTSQDFGQGSDPLPTTVGLGASGEIIDGLTAAADALKARDTSLFASIGLEYRRRFDDRIAGAVRAGWSSRLTDIDGIHGIAAGGGLVWGRVAFDFAWTPFGDLGNSFQYSLSVKF